MFLKDLLYVSLPATHGHVTVLLHIIPIFTAAVRDITGVMMQQQFGVASH